jgi:hypothetical protein
LPNVRAFFGCGKETRVLRKSLLAAATVALVLTASSPAPAQEQEGLLSPPAPAPGDVGPGYDPYGYPEPPPPDGSTSCQYEPEGCEGPSQYFSPYIPQPGEPEAAPDLGGSPADAPTLDDDGGPGAGGDEPGTGPVEAATGDPTDAAAFSSAIEAARADRAGRNVPAASEAAGDEVAVEEAAPGEGAAVDGVAAVEGGAPEDETDETGAAFGDAGSGGAAIRVPPGTSGAPPLMVLGAGSVFLVGAGLLLRRLVR